MEFSNDEKQLISTLNWFRTRYALYQGLDRERKATKTAIESFGETWIGKFKLDWSNTFSNLVKKEIIQISQDEYIFTKHGLRIKEQLDLELPFYKYEYDNYFHLESNSDAHKEFCNRVYGNYLSQHGLTNQEELTILIDQLQKDEFKNVLDLGCGNGKITAYLSQFSNSKFYGLDISEEAINRANSRVTQESKVVFQVGNMDNLQFSNNYFDAVISIDTLYYSNDLKALIKKLLKLLSPKGVIYTYYSQWIMDESDKNSLKGNNTDLAKHLNELGVEFTYRDLTTSGLNHWKFKLQVLEELKPQFKKEGSLGLWRYRYGEAFRYANWGDDKYARYFYRVQK